MKYEDLIENNLSKRVVRNKKYVSTENTYYETCVHGFEFTHHDVMDIKQRKRIHKRCQRMIKLKKKNINILYHHRYCPSTNMPLLFNDLNKISEIYVKRGNKVNIFCFWQVIVSNESERKVEYDKIDNINMYCFHTLNIWEGSNQDIFWARCDNDLIKKMICDMKKK